MRDESTDSQTARQPDRKIARQTDRQKHRQPDSQTARQPDRTDTETERRKEKLHLIGNNSCK